MDLSGNSSLLDYPLVAFFSSRRASSDALRCAQRWANDISKDKRVVISGFHSPIERAVLDILLKNRCPVIVALGRSLYRKIPAHLKEAYDNNRVLFVSFRSYSRHSLNNAQLRNWAIAQLANEIVLAPFDDSSQLSSLYHTFANGSTPCSILSCSKH